MTRKYEKHEVRRDGALLGVVENIPRTGEWVAFRIDWIGTLDYALVPITKAADRTAAENAVLRVDQGG